MRILLQFLLLVVTSHILVAQAPLVVRPQFDSTFQQSPHSYYPFKQLKRPRVGLVLSGGGSRGAGQIGVLKAFEQHDIPIDFISATSMGAIIGGLYASGYTTTQIETLALTTNWDEVLAFSDQLKRRDLSYDQKRLEDWSILTVRFQGLEPVIPHAVSSGQRLTNFLSEQTLQAIYHPNPSFDQLKIPFRAVTTDLISGRRIVLERGSLAEALRATSTVPMLFNPIERDSMQLIDGGLVTNIPVDVADSAGCDVVIAVNSTSGLRNADELKAPWQTADQIMGIMMQASNQEQLKRADVTITPEIGRHLSSDFTGLDKLIALGFRSAEAQVDSIRTLYAAAISKLDEIGEDSIFNDVHVEFRGEGVADTLIQKIKREAYTGKLSSFQIRKHCRWLYSTGNLKDIRVEVFPDARPVNVLYFLEPNPTLLAIEFSGNTLISSDSLMREFTPLFRKPINKSRTDAAIEGVLRLYRERGYSLARVNNSRFDEATGVLHFSINEGVINDIRVIGGARTEDSFVLRELGMKEGDVFSIANANQGLSNLNSTKVFEYVYLEVSYENQKPHLTLRISELPSQLIRFGMRADDDRKLQATIDVRDENFRGIGTELALTLGGGARNGIANLEFKSNKLFSPFFTFSISGFMSIFNSYLYNDDPNETRSGYWARQRVGEYSEVRKGGRLVVGGLFDRLGNATAEWSFEDARIRSLESADGVQEHHTLSVIKFATAIDSRDQYPFPISGINFKLSYEFASKNFLSDVGYNAVRFFYESYRSWGRRSVFCPRVFFGFADATMPLSQQFRYGGREMMFGTREDDRRGRQLLALSVEYRYQLPLQFLFDTYVRVRYDLGSISAFPEQITLNTFRHGIGAELAFDTPLGEAAMGAGTSFFFAKDLPDKPIQQGPVLLYFVLGYTL